MEDGDTGMLEDTEDSSGAGMPEDTEDGGDTGMPEDTEDSSGAGMLEDTEDGRDTGMPEDTEEGSGEEGGGAGVEDIPIRSESSLAAILSLKLNMKPSARVTNNSVSNLQWVYETRRWCRCRRWWCRRGRRTNTI